MLKVLVVNTVKVTIDGINAVIMNYFSNTHDEDIHFDFVFINEPYDAMREYILSRGSKYTVIGGRMRAPHKYISRLAKTAEGYDIMHAHGNSCTLAVEMYAARKAGVPVRISHSHNSSNKYALAHKLLRPVFERCVTDGFACGELAGKWLFGKKPFTVINNGISTGKYAFDADVRAQYRAELGWEDKIILGHIGNFFPRKNDTFLIDVLEQLRRADDRYVLVSIGDGGVRQEVEEKARQLGLSDAVIFTGLRSDAEKFMQAMDIFVLPSLYEGLPLTLIEAQAAGLECVASDTVTDEVDISGDIKYLPLGDGAEKWACEIRALDIGSREKLSAQRCEMIDRAGYGIETAAHRLAQLYRDLVKERKL